MRSIYNFTLVLCFVGIVACAGPSYRADKTPSGDAARPLPAEKGVVIDTQNVRIEFDAERAQAIGAVVGGVIANQATGDSDEAIQTVATVAGTAGGAIVGDLIADKALSPAGEELIIELESGDVITLTQEPGQAKLQTGDKVWVVRGSSRVRVFRRAE